MFWNTTYGGTLLYVCIVSIEKPFIFGVFICFFLVVFVVGYAPLECCWQYRIFYTLLLCVRKCIFGSGLLFTYCAIQAQRTRAHTYTHTQHRHKNAKNRNLFVADISYYIDYYNILKLSTLQIGIFMSTHFSRCSLPMLTFNFICTTLITLVFCRSRMFVIYFICSKLDIHLHSMKLQCQKWQIQH